MKLIQNIIGNIHFKLMMIFKIPIAGIILGVFVGLAECLVFIAAYQTKKLCSKRIMAKVKLAIIVH